MAQAHAVGFMLGEYTSKAVAHGADAVEQLARPGGYWCSGALPGKLGEPRLLHALPHDMPQPTGGAAPVGERTTGCNPT